VTVFLDLDNTLVDRDGAFASWAQKSVIAWGGDATDVEWLIEVDAHGYTPRPSIASMIIERLHLASVDLKGLVDQLRYEHVDRIECYPGVLARLDALRAIGERLVIITNGDARQQRMKLQRTGLADIVAGSAISGELGFKKPDARIFEAARALADTDGVAWMVGDHVEADIAGARAAGFETAWVSHGRSWSEEWAPTVVEGTTAALLGVVENRIRAGR
jgi:HAD superfamily hydrolase (TIGR01549 family)